MSTRLAALVIGTLVAVSGTLAAAQTKPATSPTQARIDALRAAQLAAQTPRMPDLVGQMFQSAQQDPRVLRLKLQLVPRQRPASDQRPGLIVDQDPPANTPVKPGTSVVVVVTVADGGGRSGAQPVIVPNVINMFVRDGSAVLSKSNLDVQVQFIDAARQAPGTIVDQKPAPNTRVAQRSTVQVLVARARTDPPPDSGRGATDVKPPPIETPQPPRLFPMPDLAGRSLSAAQRDPRVTNLDLRLIPQDDFAAFGPPGTIVRQSVPPGTGIEAGRSVAVAVATGVAVPQVVQQQADLAERRIVALGLNPRRDQEVSDLMSGVVLRQVPEAGVVVARGAAVSITIAVPRRVKIPNLVGRTRADAVQELAQLRLRASPVNDTGSTMPPEQVVAQVPIGGTEVTVGATVQIAVATGVEVPNLTGLSLDEAQRSVAGRGLSFEDVDQETGAAPAGQVFQQQPPAGTMVTRGSRVQATVAVPVRALPPAAPVTPVTPQLETPAPPALTPIPAPVVDAAPAAAVPAVVQPGGGTRAPAQSQAPAQSGGGAAAVAIPVEPLLPPWLLTLLVAAAAIAVSTVKLWWPGSHAPPPPIHAARPATPPAAIDVRPEHGDTTQRLEVAGRSLIALDVRVRVGRDAAEQSLEVHDGALILDERRLYE